MLGAVVVSVTTMGYLLQSDLSLGWIVVVGGAVAIAVPIVFGGLFRLTHPGNQ